MAGTVADNKEEYLFHYDFKNLKLLMEEIIRQTVPDNFWHWLEGQGREGKATIQLTTAFASIPRRSGRAIIKITEEQHCNLQSARSNLSIRHWTIDRLSRAWLLLQLSPIDKELYAQTLENFFLAAEMTELVALYSALPLLAYPEHWRSRCVEGIRSNIGDVLQSIMCLNPYPSEQLNEAAWNQMVLKAFFTEKPVDQIIGLDERANPRLANTLADYADERFSAGRAVNPLLWRCVAKFIDERIFETLQRLFNSKNEIGRGAAALACYSSNFTPAKKLIETDPSLKTAIETGRLNWQRIAEGHRES
jgi:hypothetical protein